MKSNRYIIDPIQIGEECFRFSAYPKSLEDAQARCESEGSNLVSVVSWKLQRELVEMIKEKRKKFESFKEATAFWIGAKFDDLRGGYHWPYHSQEFDRYTNWLGGEEGISNQLTESMSIALVTAFLQDLVALVIAA